MTLDANKALIRYVFEKVIPAGDSTAMRDLVAQDWVDHDPLPGQRPASRAPITSSPRCTALTPTCASPSTT